MSILQLAEDLRLEREALVQMKDQLASNHEGFRTEILAVIENDARIEQSYLETRIAALTALIGDSPAAKPAAPEKAAPAMPPATEPKEEEAA